MLLSLDVIGTGLFALAGACVIVGVLVFWTRASTTTRTQAHEPVAFLFEGPHLVDATPAGRRALKAQASGDDPDLSRLLRFLERGFGPDLGQRLAALPSGGRLSLASPTGAGTLEATEEGGALRLILHTEKAGASAIDRLAFQASQEEVRLLRGLAEDAPQPIWALGARGDLTWANKAYLALADLATAPPDEPDGMALKRTVWPAQPLFAVPRDLGEDGTVHQERLPLAPPGSEEPSWFDVTSVRRGTGSLHFASDVTELVQAEAARLHFVQTLAKTFTDLATGLAVFDRARRLVLFNPAFLDLTGLPIDFLSGRPLVQAVLDRLRDARILPEPRDYAAWRESVAALEEAAAQGEYRETWTLPGGQTYRVTGRPHPDGALAFLFEDISGEVGLARRMRTDLDTTRSVLDALGEPLAVFSATGALSLSNTAYAGLWDPLVPPVPNPDLIGETSRWEEACLPSSIWTAFRKSGSSRPAPFDVDLRLRDGRRLALHVTRLPQGAMLVRFRLGASENRFAAEKSELLPDPTLQPEPA